MPFDIVAYAFTILQSSGNTWVGGGKERISESEKELKTSVTKESTKERADNGTNLGEILILSFFFSLYFAAKFSLCLFGFLYTGK